MRYVQLRAFHNVAVHGGFSRAAEALHLTQPAISDQVRRLESEYDVRLFDRAQKRVTLTEAGRKLFEITHRLFEVEEEALDLLTESRAIKSGRLSIVADSAHHILDVLAAFRGRHPDVKVSVSTGNSGDVYRALATYDADIGVVGEKPNDVEFDSIKLSSGPIVAFAPSRSRWGRRPAIRLEDLANAPLVMREEGSKTRAKLEEAFDRNGLKPASTIEAEGREAVREIVASVSSSEQRPLSKFSRRACKAPWLTLKPPALSSSISCATAVPSRP